MVSRGHVLYFLLLPLLAQVAADDADEQIMSEVMNAEQQDSRTSGLMRSSPSSSSSPQSHSNPLLAPLPDSPLLPPPSLLFQLLQRVSAAAAPQEASSVDGGSAGPESFDDDDNNGEVRKRVFCNGFTGCGGRHRDRSRRQGMYGKRLIPVLVKRPFCNSFGCYNGKRSLPPTPALSSASSSSSSSLVEPTAAEEEFRARALARLLAAASRRQQQKQRAETAGPRVVVGAGGGLVGKRLFCNGYGGCRGGKRSLFSPWMSKMSGVVSTRR